MPSESGLFPREKKSEFAHRGVAKQEMLEERQIGNIKIKPAQWIEGVEKGVLWVEVCA